MATMDPGQRGFGQQQRFNIPNLPFAGAAGAPPGGMPPRGPAGAGNAPFIDQIQRLFPQGQIPPELLQMLMARLMAGQGGGARTAGPRRAMRGAQQGARGQQRPMAGGAPRQRPPMGGGRPRQRPPMGGGRPRQRPPMGGGRPRQRPPMGGGQQPVIKIEDLVRALSGRGGGASQADMPVPQARR